MSLFLNYLSCSRMVLFFEATPVENIIELVLGCFVVKCECPRNWERPERPHYMVRSEGLEPPTPWFEALCSIFKTQ
jgi:hypothetical protein